VAKAARKTIHVCQACGHVEARWMGRCPQCAEWNSLVEEVPAGGRGGTASARVPADAAEPIAIDAVADAAPEHRLATGIGELDRVLGGGLVPGSLVLLGG
jgi:DNA repair protein RadA/Sms